VATWYDSAWIGGTATGWIFIQICDNDTKHSVRHVSCIPSKKTWRRKYACYCHDTWYLMTMMISNDKLLHNQPKIKCIAIETNRTDAEFSRLAGFAARELAKLQKFVGHSWNENSKIIRLEFAPTIQMVDTPLQITRSSSADEIANVNFFNDDIVHVLKNTINSRINSATGRRSVSQP